ncbi:Lrp/AsnC ligand binding domain-containing protein, partial [Candidatus Bathyarchaeota archaeon]|nr:Lrp/AsnC ligand binding domain-containing protein [Candidatus Bathyarchaeota archaeon]
MAVLAYVLVTLNPGTEKDMLKKIAYLNEVTRVSMMYGEYDAIIKVNAESLDQLNEFLTDKLRVLPDIFQTATLIV